MKRPPPPDSHDPAWHDLVQRARHDSPPPVNLPALLHAVREAHSAQPAPATSRSTWTEDFAALFVLRRALAFCLTGAAAGLAFTVWQAWEVSQALAWADLLSGLGGVP